MLGWATPSSHAHPPSSCVCKYKFIYFFRVKFCGFLRKRTKQEFPFFPGHITKVDGIEIKKKKRKTVLVFYFIFIFLFPGRFPYWIPTF
jgi:hypothetical protein